MIPTRNVRVCVAAVVATGMLILWLTGADCQISRAAAPMQPAAQSRPADTQPAADTCLLILVNRLAKQSDRDLQFGLRRLLAQQSLEVRKGDALVYDIYMLKGSPDPRVYVNAWFDTPGVVGGMAGDRHGRPQGEPAETGKWIHREIPIDEFAGRRTRDWTIDFAGQKDGWYGICLRNIALARVDGSRASIYSSGAPPLNEDHGRLQGYSRLMIVEPVPAKLVTDGADLAPLTDRLIARAKFRAALDDARVDVKVLAELLAGDTDAATVIKAAQKTLATLDANADLSDAQAQAVLAKLADDLADIAPKAQEYTAHLVGHAHIDTMWCWPYSETIIEFRDTFGQAVKFMEEFPDFTFSQSSSGFYQGTEAAWPELFGKIKKYVREGRWELVGGTVCEGDTNIVSGESLARQFLYGQRYFRERFGKQAQVAWEPDTFGHSAQMPQIARLGGCEGYYFTRTLPRGKPLFWWQGLDGSPVLAYCGTGYAGGVDEHRLDYLAEHKRLRGASDDMWVYGVGNHGGGPTRESILAAKAMMAKPYLPAVRFSTAAAFFEALLKQDLARLMVTRGEMNFVFRGCYTTRGDIKRLNDDCQAWNGAAETVAAVAARYGFAYPGLQLRQNWEDTCWNQHHDTLGGSSVSGAYDKSRDMLGKVLASDRRIVADAMAALAGHIKADGPSAIVFNPGGARDTVVEIDLPEGVASAGGCPLQPVEPTPASTPFLTTQPASAPAGKRVIFLAHDLPSVGYRVYPLGVAAKSDQPAVKVSHGGTKLESDKLAIMLDPKTGQITSLKSAVTGREMIAQGKSANRMEVHWEEPADMGPWEIGKIAKIDVLDNPIMLRVIEKGPVRCTVELSRPFAKSTITQRVSLTAGADQVECTLLIDWKEVSDGKSQCPFLKMAFDLDLPEPVATFGIPFGSLRREANGDELPFVNWLDVATKDGKAGVSLMCDAKHGCGVTGSAVRLSLVRAPFRSGPTDAYPQVVRYAIRPHKGDAAAAGVAQSAMAFVTPVLTHTAAANAAGTLPAERSFVSVGSAQAVITAVKRAEDDDDLVVRLYESTGAPARARLQTHWKVQFAAATNLIEDAPKGPPASEPATAPADNAVELNLRPWEIRTTKLRLKPVSGVTPAGTRGPSSVRQY